ncbi:MAG TPA: hypothetical protein VHB21_28435 [Minicystis sp.]|nr:hypothetical protein [Minicystis sp.]
MNKRNFAAFVVLASAALAASAGGCELIAAVDRNEIPGSGGGGSSPTGTGGTSSTTTPSTGPTGGGGTTATGTTTTPGTGGTGGTGAGGTMGMGGTGGMGAGGAMTGGGGTASSSSSASSASASSSSASSSSGAGGACPTMTCSVPGDCTTPPPNQCVTNTCAMGCCGTQDVSAGPAPNQTAGDCQQAMCDGSGGLTQQFDATDPQDDANECTLDACVAGNPPSTSHTPIAGSCANGTKVCGTPGGPAEGTCVDCNSGADCPSGVCTSNVCQMPSCTDMVQNGSESDVDCGQACAPTLCAYQKKCAANADCASNLCDVGGTNLCLCSGNGDCTAPTPTCNTTTHLCE